MALTDTFHSNWKDELRDASFRGVEFKVQGIETSAGRKTATHVFPGSNVDYIEDLGRATRKFSVDAYVIGKRYLEYKNKLIDACEEEGPGTLVHPYMGYITVALVEIARIRETSADGGMAIITLVFSETEEPDTPLAEDDTLGALADMVEETIAAVGEFFDGVFDIFQSAKHIVDEVSATIYAAATEIESIKSKAGQALNFQDNISNLKNNTAALITSAASVGTAFKEIFFGDETKRAVQDNLNFYNYLEGEYFAEQNKKALVNMIRQTAIVGAANVIPNISFQSRDEAIEIRELLSDAIDFTLNDISAETIFQVDRGRLDILYEKFWTLRALIIQDIDQRSINLPVLLEYTIPASLPVLFVAYDLYENIDRAQEVIDANDIIHPGFVPGGVPLEVLSRE